MESFERNVSLVAFILILANVGFVESFGQSPIYRGVTTRLLPRRGLTIIPKSLKYSRLKAGIDSKRLESDDDDDSSRIIVENQPAAAATNITKDSNNVSKKGKLFKLSELDELILGTAIPSMINLAVVPLVNSVDTFWVGRMGIALALAGQSAANYAFFTFYFLVAFLPTITAPLVATAVGSGDQEAAQDRVCESLFLGNLLGLIGTVALVGFPRLVGLRFVLPDGAPATNYAAPYLRWRALSMTSALLSATGFAAYRGMLNTVTPLKVSLFINAINLVLDPLLIGPFGFVGAAIATAFSEMLSGFIYLRLLLKKKLATWRKLTRPPSWKALQPIIQGGLSMLMRQMGINIAIVAAARRAQAIDPTGVAAAAYGIVMQMYSVGIVIHVALQGTAAAMVPSAMAKSGKERARSVADRIFIWSTIIGFLLGLSQYLALPFLIPLFTPLPEVRSAVKIPALIACVTHFINGPVFAGEGTMMGLGRYKDLAFITASGVITLVGSLLTPLGKNLNGILVANMIFCATIGVGVTTNYFRHGPLARRKLNQEAATSTT